MAAKVAPPLLFLDVDGPLIPFGDPSRTGTSRSGRPSATSAANPLLSRLDIAHGAELAALPCELVWATAWMSEANECIAPLLGLPRLPVVEWPQDCGSGELDTWYGLHWKTRHLVGWADGRAFVWIATNTPMPTRTGCERITAVQHCCTGSIPGGD